MSKQHVKIHDKSTCQNTCQINMSTLNSMSNQRVKTRQISQRVKSTCQKLKIHVKHDYFYMLLYLNLINIISKCHYQHVKRQATPYILICSITLPSSAPAPSFLSMSKISDSCCWRALKQFFISFWFIS